MKRKLLLILSCVGILIACQNRLSETTPSSPGEIPKLQVETPPTSPTLEPIFPSNSTVIPTKIPKQTQAEEKVDILVTHTPQEEQVAFWIRPMDEMRMVNVPSGTFQMGSTEAETEAAIALCREHYHICNRWYYERENPLHLVSLDSFWIDLTEISNSQYRLCVEAGICAEPTNCEKGEPTFDDPDKVDHPVVCVNWEEAQSYCEWAGARLPTEAEWEYASRGESGSIYPWGDDFDGSKLNYCDSNCSQTHADDRFNDGFPLTAPVGSYPLGASWSGVLDFGGNVSEWVADWLGDFSPESISNPLGPSTGVEKIVKGCSWFFHPTYCRGAARASVGPDTRLDYLGFRCVSTGKKKTEKGSNINWDPIVIPTGSPPTIDGTHSSGEWDKAAIETFADGSPLLLMRAEDYLYLGIRVTETGMVAGNVFIQRGDEISVLHTSAALGTVVYQKTETDWRKIQDFTWCCRSTGNGEAAQAERAEFLQDEGWLAANGLMGTPNELEYQIKIPDQNIRLAVVYIKSNPPHEKIPWPEDLDDDCIKPTSGGLPTILKFSPDRWGALQLTSPTD
jgi:formylglycine-generating enzyme required for sulfatase activity